MHIVIYYSMQVLITYQRHWTKKIGTVDLCSNSPNSFFQADTILVLIFRVHIVQSPHEGSLLKLSTSQSRRQNVGETERGRLSHRERERERDGFQTKLSV